jgi:methyl-accepting chemotaxis protein
MGDLVARIKTRFDKVNSLSEGSFDNSKELSQKGENLIQSAKDMVVKSDEGRDLVNKVEELIFNLDNSLRKPIRK